MIAAIVAALLRWLAPDPSVAAEACVTTPRSEGYARATVAWDCSEQLQVACAERRLGRVPEPSYGDPQCTSERGETTCTVTCSGTCGEAAR